MRYGTSDAVLRVAANVAEVEVEIKMRARVVGTLGVVTVAFAIYGIVVESPFTWIYVAITVTLGVVVSVIDRLVSLPDRSLWALVGAAFCNLLGGIWLVNGQPLYVYKLVGNMAFDKPAHFFATAMATWAAYEALRFRLSATALGLGFVAVMMGMGASALVEIVEFVASQTMDNVNVGGYSDNMLDLVANFGGSILAAFLAGCSEPLVST